jgi:hypothetical protein
MTDLERLVAVRDAVHPLAQETWPVFTPLVAPSVLAYFEGMSVMTRLGMLDTKMLYEAPND